VGRPRWQAVLFLLVAFIAALLAGCGSVSGSAGRVVAPPAEEESGVPVGQAAPPAASARIPIIAALVTRVVDGDTVYVRLAGGRTEKVRLIGVDAPESTGKVEPYGKKAAAYTKRRLSGRSVYLELDVGERDKYGRLLAYVWLSPPETGSDDEVRSKMFNAELLLAGMAQVMTVPPNVKYADLFAKLQEEAREEGKGLWGAGAGSAG
jgi:micrococcal nuclease